MHIELSPESLLEETLTAEITGASWRLRRCSAVEGELADYAIQDPLLDETKEKTIRSIERARSSAHSLLHRSINQLRRLQTDRSKSTFTLQPAEQAAPPAELASNCPPPPQPLTKADLESLLEPPAEFLANLDAILAEHAGKFPPGQMASICSNIQPTRRPVPQTPRNAPCPCKSGEKFKRCCGRNAPPVLNRAA
jgi:hypothetical protein